MNKDELKIKRYDKFIKKVRGFFRDRKFIEVPEMVHTITGSCEYDPTKLVICKKNGMIQGLPQSNLKWIQHLLHRFNHGGGGVFMLGTSYNKTNISPILDFAAYGTFEDLIELLTEFCVYMGFDKKDILFHNPMDINILKESECLKFKDKKCMITTGLDKLYNKYFWSYKLVDKQYKIASVILNGESVILGGERHANVSKMMYDVYTLDNGDYIDMLYQLFSKKRVDDELLKYTNIKLVLRFGATINLERLFEKIQ
jgi:hypothetical protein